MTVRGLSKIVILSPLVNPPALLIAHVVGPVANGRAGRLLGVNDLTVDSDVEYTRTGFQRWQRPRLS